MTSIVGVDVGGTFTDAYVFDADGKTRAAKAPTSEDTVSGVLAALEQVVAPDEVEALSFGSTIATNALVQRRLARVGLLTTSGFRDTLEIRRLWRRDLFGHAWDRPAAIVPRSLRLEAGGRIDWRGAEIEPLDEPAVEAAAARFAALGVEAVAVAFLFSYLNQDHERRAAQILKNHLGHLPILISSDVNPERNEYERSSTTAIAAGLAPIVDHALAAVESRLGEAGLRRAPRIMKSNGGVMSVRAARNRPVELVKSGPAGGASAGAYLAELLDEPDLLLIDIGGTTADASLILDGRPARADFDALQWDVPMRVPVVDIRSIGAGGGSIARLDEVGALRVGPQSAGAVPGPVAYGQGGSDPTVTDAALTGALLDPDFFLGGRMSLDVEAARRSLQPIADGLDYSLEEAAAAVMHVVTVEMAALLRKITLDRGLDPRSLTLVGFGGAGPFFVGSLLEELGMQRGIVPLGAATLSAMGGAFADITFDYRRSEIALVDDVRPDRLADAFGGLLARAEADLAAEGLEDAVLTTSVDLRYAGQWHEIEVPFEAGSALTEAARQFEDAHERKWGHRRAEDAVEMTGVRVRAVSRTSKPTIAGVEMQARGTDASVRRATYFGVGTVDTAVHDRGVLARGTSIPGPAIVEEPQTTTVVPPGLHLSVGDADELVVTR